MTWRELITAAMANVRNLNTPVSVAIMSPAADVQSVQFGGVHQIGFDGVLLVKQEAIKEVPISKLVSGQAIAAPVLGTAEAPRA